ncbi:LPXTG cell wall anchor domain-containing protein [Enterococcus sp. AZ109]|uniref:LPXTG cell wall anchor domain-containing protein n=1 Tax=Enterococcus sp. AZ109 TaxID=2774634 RepID=UPI003F22EF1A
MVKRKTIVSTVLISLLFSLFAFTFSSTAVHASSYGSNGQIGFYGEYEEPAEDPAGGSSGTLPGTTTGRGVSYGTSTSGSKTLPQTGQSNYFGISLMGYTLLGFLLLLIVKNKKGELKL